MSSIKRKRKQKMSPTINEKVKKRLKPTVFGFGFGVMLKKVILIKKKHNSYVNSAFRTATSCALISEKFIFISAPMLI